MKFCPRCGQSANDEFKFCMACGADISGTAPAMVMAAPPAAVVKPTSDKTIWIVVGLIAAFLAIPVVLIVAAIAIPNLLRARMAANEASAVGSVRTINAAEGSYAASYVGFSHTLAELGGGPPCAPSAEHACLIDEVLAQSDKNGYHFRYEAGDPAADSGNTSQVITSYRVYAIPIQPNSSGRRSFYSDQSGVIRYSTAGEPDENSPPLD
jgi:type IV pilus assembly protein PilA